MSSIAAIATNDVPAYGGVLYVLSTSLGTGFGGAISVLYFFGVAYFATIEIAGSVDGLMTAMNVSLTGQEFYDRLCLNMALLVLVLLPTLISEKLVHRLSVFFMTILGLSFATVFAGIVAAPSVNGFNGQVTGVSLKTLMSNLKPSSVYELNRELSFLLPCFVGIYTGTNNAASLRNPVQSIPIGGFSSIGINMALYTGIMVLLGATVKRGMLLSNPLIMSDIAWPSPLFALPGIVLIGYGYLIHTKSEHVTLGTGFEDLLYFLSLSDLCRREKMEYTQNVQRVCLPGSPFTQSTNNPEALPSILEARLRKTAPITTSLPPSKPIFGIWRPQILAFVKIDSEGTDLQHPRLVSFISQLKVKGSVGDLCVLANIITPSTEQREVRKLQSWRLDTFGLEAESTEREKMIVLENEILFRRRLILQRAMDEENMMGFAKEDMDEVKEELNKHLKLLRINVDQVKVVPISIFNTDAVEVAMQSPSVTGSIRRRKWESLMQSALIEEIRREDEDLQHWNDEQIMEVAEEKMVNETRGFIQSWVHDVRSLPNNQRRDLFLKAHTTMQIKRIIKLHSASSENPADLVILNLPTPDVQQEELNGLNAMERAGLYMDMIEFLTVDLKRVLLVHT
ncbi:hypothetical protein HDV05_000623, partial [Chytridiales sp. JEL 0842]